MMPIQKVVVAVGLLLLFALMFPPFQSIHPNGGASNAGYSFILFPPKGAWGFAKIDIAVLLIEWLGIILIGGAYALFIFLPCLKKNCDK